MKIAVIGAGAWGTTLSILLAEKGHDVSLWVYEKELAEQIKKTRENKTFLPGFPLPEAIEITHDLKTLCSSEVFFFVVPTQFLRAIAKQASPYISPNAIVVSASKGIEEKSLKLPLAVLKDELKTRNLVALSGPNLSREIAKGLPAAAVVACEKIEVAKTIQDILMLPRFRVYVNSDPLGVQLGGALKNIIAISAGVCDGLELGNNAKAALLIRAISEIMRLGVAMGAKQNTFFGLSGMGDLITTCQSKLSRNHRVGEQIARGKKLNEILAEMKAVAEGVFSTKAALALGKKFSVDLPVTHEVYKVLYEDKKAFQSISDLMTREATSE
ncbi:MAG: NAD(P)-dependent glycerol-3-phosphate dehydrogenase [Candidatus Saganbacteria bacterium]|nr:NAD(P)-dependent glycerol-3-phosphate dehydrogenase [Candidatus Saganbacteria bacterium]